MLGTFFDGSQSPILFMNHSTAIVSSVEKKKRRGACNAFALGDGRRTDGWALEKWHRVSCRQPIKARSGRQVDGCKKDMLCYNSTQVKIMSCSFPWKCLLSSINFWYRLTSKAFSFRRNMWIYWHDRLLLPWRVKSVTQCRMGVSWSLKIWFINRSSGRQFQLSTVICISSIAWMVLTVVEWNNGLLEMPLSSPGET